MGKCINNVTLHHISPLVENYYYKCGKVGRQWAINTDSGPLLELGKAINTDSGPLLELGKAINTDSGPLLELGKGYHIWFTTGPVHSSALHVCKPSPPLPYRSIEGIFIVDSFDNCTRTLHVHVYTYTILYIYMYMNYIHLHVFTPHT